jgi:hypothetical protein
MMPKPHEPLYLQRPQPVTISMVPQPAPHGPTILEPGLSLRRIERPHAHLWEPSPQGLRCYHCHWSYRAVLARNQAQREGIP